MVWGRRRGRVGEWKERADEGEKGEEKGEEGVIKVRGK